MSTGRITRKEMKRDELASTLGDLAGRLEQHSRSLAVAGLALVALGLAVGGGFWYSRSRASASRTALAAVYDAASAPVAPGAVSQAGAPAFSTPRQKQEEVVRRADEVISGYPGTQAAAWAAYMKAVGQKELGDFSGALQSLEPLLGSGQEEFISSSARLLQAQIKEAQGDLPGAVDAYAALAASAPARFPVELALLAQAKLLEKQGRKDEADGIYRRITGEFADSPMAEQARSRLSPPAPGS